MPDLAGRLHELKQRSGLSYAGLATRCGISASAVHRYCRGQVLPDSYGMVERIARVCGAGRDELAELYRLWEHADAARSTARGDAVPERVIGDAVADTEPAARRASPRQRLRVVRWLGAVGCLLAVVMVGATASSPVRHNAARPEQNVPGPAWSQYPAAVPGSFYGVTVNSGSGAMPTFRVGAVRLWDSGSRWALVEPERGRYDWSVLDRLVDGARQVHLPVLYTFGGTPSWAAPDAPPGPYTDGSRAAPPDAVDDWVRFVRAVATRYAGRITAYELWVLAPSPHFFTGDAATLARMTQRASAVIRRADPRATVVCPSIGKLWEPPSRRFLRDFAAAGGYQYCDAAGVKLYPRHEGDTPETFVGLGHVIDRTFHEAGVHPPLWDTGTTYRIPEDRPLDQAHAIAYAARFYLIGMYLRYERMYFYNWGGTKIPLVLQAVGGGPTAAARAVDRLQRWLTGARITSCGHGHQDGLPGQVWECRYLLAAPHGGGPVPAVIRWTESGTAAMPADRGARTVRSLDGTSGPAPRTLRITEQPVLITLSSAG
ncbi:MULTISPECIES: helix-turn-helix domain-containing protein [unclassified Streptomyces]|uniref:helix-turn-helix domain-containing protein n=1 Tax=unclassified Streptomyces TaxID=2593676 RepID=UPI001F03CDB3|nr:MULTISPECIES: helix-turn-helix domain-containing protein [unclassified Streptomyces]MCH0564805.1 helix-turn-helix domain-containing protein [Streptomyces sp. MUM 2J]MCH0569913.1 helix-turn-helix domain-containing protein [Streptomyces sp. MUM 136J]